MGEAGSDRAVARFLATVQVGDRCSGTIVAVTRSHATVTLDGFAARPLGEVGTLDGSWRRRFAEVRGSVTKLVPFGVFVQVADGVEGLVPPAELSETPVSAPEGVVGIGDEVAVMVTDLDREGRRLTLSRRRV
ncbi:S1 RNA-binding domain-containing protein [Streptomyces sp. NPDC088387]|uniref:S1 RNA-binding domain-containing protein n=1 Tax=Streptomyces sp. NPDC088387 TaxID=3365859 RepID=UPI003817FDFE